MSLVSTKRFAVRQMTRPDVDLALDWAAAEGWNPGLHDGESFFDADPTGFFLGELDGEPIGSFSAVAYNESYGFLGLFIVREGFRGLGYGRQLWDAGMTYLGTRNVGLDGVLAQQDSYGRRGFHAAYRTVRHEGISGAVAAPAEIADAKVVELTTVPAAELVAYDSQCFPAERPQFLESWIRRPETVALGVLRGDRLAGYGVLRRCRVGSKIGPLLADDRQLAQQLLERLTARRPGEPFYLDTPEVNPAALELARRHKTTPMFETSRMYTVDPPAIDMRRVFGVTTLELG